MHTDTTPPSKSRREKIGWACMLTGFVLIILSGVTYYVGPRSAHTALYAALGNYLMAAGFVMYIVGRVVRGRVRRVSRY